MPLIMRPSVTTRIRGSGARVAETAGRAMSSTEDMTPYILVVVAVAFVVVVSLCVVLTLVLPVIVHDTCDERVGRHHGHRAAYRWSHASTCPLSACAVRRHGAARRGRHARVRRVSATTARRGIGGTRHACAPSSTAIVACIRTFRDCARFQHSKNFLMIFVYASTCT